MASRTDDRVWTGGMRPGWTVTVVQREAAEQPAEAAAAAGRPLSELDDATLVALCVAGRREAFDPLVERHRRAVYQLCYRFAGNHEDASDCSQEVFLRAYRGLRNFKGRSSLSTWLYRIGVNVCLNRVGTKTPVAAPLDEGHPAIDRGEGQGDRVLRHERAALVRAAIAKLPRKQRATLILRVYHDLPHRDIAEILGSSVGAVKANFFHALGNLKRLLGTEPL